MVHGEVPRNLWRNSLIFRQTAHATSTAGNTGMCCCGVRTFIPNTESNVGGWYNLMECAYRTIMYCAICGFWGIVLPVPRNVPSPITGALALRSSQVHFLSMAVDAIRADKCLWILAFLQGFIPLQLNKVTPLVNATVTSGIHGNQGTPSVRTCCPICACHVAMNQQSVVADVQSKGYRWCCGCSLCKRQSGREQGTDVTR